MRNIFHKSSDRALLPYNPYPYNPYPCTLQPLPLHHRPPSLSFLHHF
jgi:hypothetical protein